MIRINLYPGGQRAKRGRRAAVPDVGGDGGNLIGLLLVIALVGGIAAVGNFTYYWRLNHETARLQNDMSKADMTYARLSQVKIRYLEREKQKDLYKKRIDVIDKLRADQSGPVSLLSMLGSTINHTDEVWLNTMTDDGASLHLNGVALSVHGVADLMRNLQNTGFFKSVDIKASYQDETVRDMQAFNFELICQKAAQTGPPAQPAQAPKQS